MLLSKLIILDTIDSTNNYVANLLKTQQIRHGTVILSYNQQNGRGQRGTNWLSEPYKNIAFSIFLRHTHKPFSDAQYLSYAVALATKDFFEKHEINSKIKWPNDLLADNKKIAGILIENQIVNMQLASSIVGIGINVNQVFSDDVSLTATSMTKLQNKTFNLETLVYELAECIEKRYFQFQQNKYDLLLHGFLASMWKKDEWVDAEIGGKSYPVKIEGVNENGYLLLNVEGHSKAFDIKEVKFIY